MSTPVPTQRRVRANAKAIERRAGASPVSDIAESLRRTTLKAHDAIRRGPSDPLVLRDLRREIAALEREAERLNLGGLRPFLSALRLRVEAAL